MLLLSLPGFKLLHAENNVFSDLMSYAKNFGPSLHNLVLPL